MQPNHVEQMTEPIEQMLDKIGVQTIFGAPIDQQGVTLIPVAQVAYGFGYGGGYGSSNGKAHTGDSGEQVVIPGETHEGTTADASGGEGGGVGGGAGGRATPCGYIRITPEGVTYEEISDKNRIPLAGILFAAWTVFWVTATIRTIAKAVAKTRQLKHKG